MTRVRITHADGAVWIGVATGQRLLFTTGEKRRNNPAAGSNPGAIGSDVLLDFEFPPIPDNATIESITLRVGISSDTTDVPFQRGFFFASYSRLDLTTYLNVDLGPDIVGGFLVSPETPIFAFPPLLVIQVPRGTTFEMNLAPEELTLDNVRNLSVAVAGLNEAPELFDRTTLVNATVVYTVPEPVPALSTWMMVLMGALFLGAGIIFKRRFLKS